ncbi:MAG: hypothetical protein J6Z43_06545 [Clostridiales bacterium]|jgi:hypothetical protein|nr:hypothetical protein [Clostridiales bacterium]
MNAFLGTIRKIALGGIVILVLSLILKGGLPSGLLRTFLLCCPIGYVVFVFFTWLHGKATIDDVSDEYGVSLPSPNLILTFFKAILFDVFSPITTLFGLFGEWSNKWYLLISTYVIIGAYVFIWFFII